MLIWRNYATISEDKLQEFNEFVIVEIIENNWTGKNLLLSMPTDRKRTRK